MSYDIFLAEFFKRNIKILKKKYPNVSNDLRVALRVICENPGLGKSLRGFGDIKKLRVRNSDVTKGKRSGYRLIYCADHSKKMIYRNTAKFTLWLDRREPHGKLSLS